MFSSPKAFPATPAVQGIRKGWLEPNCARGPDGRIWVIARVDHEPEGNVAALLKLSTDRKQLEFKNQYPAVKDETGFFHAPWAGSAKFHILFDDVSGRYLVMSNPYLMHLMFNFPELLLVVLAVCMLFGSYTGYRLSEVLRFKDLAIKGRD